VVHPGDGGRPPADLGNTAGAPSEATSTLDAATVAGWLLRSVPSTVGPLLDPLLSRAERRLRRDHARIAGYYGALAAEARAPRRRTDPAAIEVKVSHVLAERDHKLAELARRGTARVRVELAAALVLGGTATTATLRLRRRKSERSLRVRVSPGARSIDLLPCDGCSGWTDAPALCDDRLHLLCPTCLPVASGRPRCPACGGKGSDPEL